MSVKISVIVPAHNESQAIKSTLDALIKQDYDDFEIVIACNGCTDDTAQIAKEYERKIVKVFETEKSGMSFGKNFGAENATGELYVFVDADTFIPVETLSVVAKQIEGKDKIIGTMAGRPDKGGLVVKTCFIIANLVTRKNKVHAPGGVMVMQREVFDAIDGFDEKLPQGTSSDLIMRARKVGAEYVFINKVKATTSIRRFEKTGIIKQMLDWRKNHKKMDKGAHKEVEKKDYEVIR